LKCFDIDWAAFLDRAVFLEELRADSRAILAKLRKGNGVEEELFGDDLAPLLKAKVLQSYTNGRRVRLHEEFSEAGKVLRAMARSPIVQTPTEAGLSEYLSDNFTNDERNLLAGARSGYGFVRGNQWITTLMSTAYLRSFMKEEDLGGWEKDRIPGDDPYLQLRSDTTPRFTEPQVIADVRALIEVLGAQPQPVPLRELQTRMKRRAKARIGRAIDAAVRYAFAFPVLNSKTLLPELTLWPAIAERWCRKPTPMPSPIDSDLLKESADLPWRLEDVTQLLIAASDPIRLRSSDRTLFVKAQREVESTLAPVPHRLSLILGSGVSPETRVDEAQRLAKARGYLAETGTSGTTLRLELTDSGRAWLSLPPNERLASLLKSMRVPTEGEDEDEEDDDLQTLSYFRRELDSAVSGFLPGGSDHWSMGDGVNLDEAVTKCMGLLEEGKSYPLGPLLRHFADEHFPFGGLSELNGHRHSGSWNHLSEEQLEGYWINMLDSFVTRRLMCFGGVRTGWTAEGRTTIELTEVGRYLLRETDEIACTAAAPADNPVRIQPDFEVVFLAPDPTLEASYTRFAERLGTGVGVLFRITRDSILAAARAGLSSDEVLGVLRDSCATGVPRNVEHEVTAWFDECRVLTLEYALVLRCPDEETAARVLSAAGRRVESASPTLLVLPDQKKRAEVIRLCKKAGIFLEGGEPVKPKKKARRKRRRHYW
jgi:hypothetical protein